MRTLLIALCLIAAALPAAARDLALVIGNEDYTEVEAVRRADNVQGLVEALERAGMQVHWGQNLDLQEMRGLANRFADDAQEADRLLVVLFGRFVSTDRDRVLLPIDGEMPEFRRLTAMGLDVGLLETVLATKARGRSVLVLGDDDEDRRLGAYAIRGIGRIDAEPDFVVAAGNVRRVSGFVGSVLAEPSATYGVDTAQERRIALFGLTEGAPMRFLGEDPGGDLGARREAAAWALAERTDTEAAYRRYLEAFPFGANAATARSRLDAFAADPVRQAEAAERRLDLDRDARRGVQADLTALGYDTRGVDGIFGAGTRSAISAFQGAKGLQQTGYLDAALVALLESESARAEAEAEAQRAAREREDRAYWIATGRGQTQEGIEDYLGRYPEGLFAGRARERLAELNPQPAPGSDRADYARARVADTIPAYRRYLIERPDGAFRDQARARIAALGGVTAVGRIEAREGERALALNTFTRTLIEERLGLFGANPGPVDGVFDEQFRSAMRSYQAARGLPVTGYVSQDAVVLLLADSIFR